MSVCPPLSVPPSMRGLSRHIGAVVRPLRIPRHIRRWVGARRVRMWVGAHRVRTWVVALQISGLWVIPLMIFN